MGDEESEGEAAAQGSQEGEQEHEGGEDAGDGISRTKPSSPPKKLMKRPQCEECAILASPRATSALHMS